MKRSIFSTFSITLISISLSATVALLASQGSDLSLQANEDTLADLFDKLTEEGSSLSPLPPTTSKSSSTDSIDQYFIWNKSVNSTIQSAAQTKVELGKKRKGTSKRTYTRKKSYQCTTCKKRFKQRGNLTEHLRTHTGEKPHQCSECKRSFSKEYNFKRHMLIHEGKKQTRKRYTCTKCGRNVTDLHNHMTTHTGEKPFECSKCGNRFARKEYLKRHMVRHIKRSHSASS